LLEKIWEKSSLLIYSVSKKGLNIDGLGEKIIELFHSLGLVTDYASLFEITREDIQDLEGFGDKSVDNFLKEREKAKDQDFYKALVALGIRHVGEETAKEIAKHIASFDDLLHASYDELVALPGIGEKVALSLIEYASNEETVQRLQRLLTFLRVKNSLYKKDVSQGKLSGFTFVITGTFEQYSRDEVKALLEEHGAKVASSVSKKTNYLLAGSDAGSKLATANELGITILGEEYVKGL
jgi:DNA ligase (NAD+)